MRTPFLFFFLPLALFAGGFVIHWLFKLNRVISFKRRIAANLLDRNHAAERLQFLAQLAHDVRDN